MKYCLSIGLLFIALSLKITAQSTHSAGDLKITIDSKGFFTEIYNQKTKLNYLSKDSISPLITLISQGYRLTPLTAFYNKENQVITLKYKSDLSIDVKIHSKKTHLTFEIVKAEPKNKIEAIVWGPIPLTISKTIGEIIGVVRDDKVAVGLQVLNVKTDGGDYTEEGVPFARGVAAVAKPWGSNIQAYSINRELERYIDSWNGDHKRTPVIPLKGETVVGSKIAVFSCDEPKTLDLIEKIELAEGLPHPLINGLWTKKLYQRGHSYLIADYTEDNIDTLINYTKRAGLISLYHSGPFSNWGHFDLDTVSFPNGRAGIKKCADKAKAAGLHIGVHTLTNFITTDDKYITPLPDKRLAYTGFGLLDADIDENTKEIQISTDEYFNNEKSNNLHAVKIGNEIIRYKNVTSASPYKLTDCQRGAFGTKISSHFKYDTVGKLYDHAYKVFFPNLDLQREIAVNLAKFFNETGVDHLDFDGYEGCLASGQGNYAINLFADDFYKNLNHTVLNGTSMSKTYYWHINTFCNWGEPWYGGFKESMQEYRISNQGLFDRNLMPHMLGWYLLTKTTTISEMEWMLARASAYDAGFAMVTSIKSVEGNPVGKELLDLIREWEDARLSSAFSKEQILKMKDSKNEFHLEKINEKEWNLYQYHSSEIFVHKKIEKQPGEPTYSVWKYELNSEKQALQFTLFVNGKSGSINHVKIIIDNYNEIEIPLEIKAGQTVIYNGSNLLRIYNEKGKQINSFTINNIPYIEKGMHQITFDAKFEGDEDIQAEFSIKSQGNAEKISKK